MTQDPERGATGSNVKKDPDDWKTGDEPMTGAQRSYLETLSTEAGEPVDDALTKAEASKRIDELRRITGRGREAGTSDDGADAANRVEASADFEDDAKQVAGGRAPSDQERDAVQRAADKAPDPAREVSRGD